MANDKPRAMPRGQWSTLSYAHYNPDQLGGTSIQSKALRLTQNFERERCPFHAKQLADHEKYEAERRRELAAFKEKRRGSSMVKKDQPKPVLKPSPDLAYGIDKAAFDHAWRAETRLAKDAFKALRLNQDFSTKKSKSVRR